MNSQAFYLYAHSDDTSKKTSVSIANAQNEVINFKTEPTKKNYSNLSTLKEIGFGEPKALYCERFSFHTLLANKILDKLPKNCDIQIYPIENLIPQISMSEWAEYKNLVFEFNKHLDPSSTADQARVTAALCENIINGNEPGIYAKGIKEWCKSIDIEKSEALH